MFIVHVHCSLFPRCYSHLWWCVLWWWCRMSPAATFAAWPFLPKPLPRCEHQQQPAFPWWCWPWSWWWLFNDLFFCASLILFTMMIMMIVILKYDWENLLPDGFGLTIFRLDIVQPLSLGTNMQLPPTNYNAYGFLISRDRDWETVKMHLGMCGFIFSKIIYMSRMLHVLFDEKFRLFL